MKVINKYYALPTLILIILIALILSRWTVLDNISMEYVELDNQAGGVVIKKDRWTGNIWEQHYLLFGPADDLKSTPYFENLRGASYKQQKSAEITRTLLTIVWFICFAINILWLLSVNKKALLNKLFGGDKQVSLFDD